MQCSDFRANLVMLLFNGIVMTSWNSDLSLQAHRINVEAHGWGSESLYLDAQVCERRLRPRDRSHIPWMVASVCCSPLSTKLITFVLSTISFRSAFSMALCIFFKKDMMDVGSKQDGGRRGHGRCHSSTWLSLIGTVIAPASVSYMGGILTADELQVPVPGQKSRKSSTNNAGR